MPKISRLQKVTRQIAGTAAVVLFALTVLALAVGVTVLEHWLKACVYKWVWTS